MSKKALTKRVAITVYKVIGLGVFLWITAAMDLVDPYLAAGVLAVAGVMGAYRIGTYTKEAEQDDHR